MKLDTCLAQGLALCSVAMVAGAQTEEDADFGFALEEVVVTAQKREQSLQEIPATVNAVSGDLLGEYKLFNFEELEQVTAGLDLRQIAGRVGTIALRGVAYNPNSAAAQAVDSYWNEITLGANATGGLFQQLFDIDRIEILRGPQGTLQGRASPGGAISIHTAKPDLQTLEGYIKTSLTDNGGGNTQFAGSLPLIADKLAVRVAGFYDESELNEIRNVLDGNVSDNQSHGGRLSLAWQATEDFHVDLVYQYLENHLDQVINLTGSSTLPAQPVVLPQLDADDHKGVQLLPDIYNGRFENSSLRIEWDLTGGHQLIFVGGYSEIASRNTLDNARGNSNPDTTAFSDPQRNEDANYASSMELRLNSVDREVWNYIVGLYFGNESGHFDGFRVINAAGTRPGVVHAPFDIQNYGVFAHNIFTLSDHWRAQLGLRWQRRERHVESGIFTLEAFGPFSVGDQVIQLLSDDQGDANNEAVTGSASLSYTFDDPELMFYLNIGSSYRASGTTVSAFNLLDLAAYDDEDSWSLELGAKSTLWSDRLRINGALFYQDFNSYITRLAGIAINNGGNAAVPARASMTANGDARVRGVELEFETLLVEQWHLRAGISYTEAEFKDGVSLPCNDGQPIPDGTVANTCDVGGLEIGVQPRLSVTLSTDYSRPLGGYEAYTQLLYKFVGRRSDVDAPGGSLGGYATADLHVGLREGAKGWDLSLFARNLFDREATNNIEPQYRSRAGLETGYQRAQIIQQRTLGITALYTFD